MLTGGIAAVVAALCALTRRLLWDHPASAGGVIQFKPLWNRGAAFGLPVGRRAVAALSGLCLTWVWLCRGRNPVGAGLLLGGGTSNLWERLCHGRVFDYVHFPKAPGPLRHYVFNLADFAILAGVLALLPKKH